MKFAMTPIEIFEYKQKWKPKAWYCHIHSDLRSQCKEFCKKNYNKWEWDMDEHTEVYADSYYFEDQDNLMMFVQKFNKWIR